MTGKETCQNLNGKFYEKEAQCLCQLERRRENDNFCPNTVYGISLRADGCGGYLPHKKALARLLLTPYASICETFIPKPYPNTIQSYIERWTAQVSDVRLGF